MPLALTPCALVEGYQSFCGTRALNTRSANLPGNSKETQSRECVLVCLTYCAFEIIFSIIGVNETVDSRTLFGEFVSVRC